MLGLLIAIKSRQEQDYQDLSKRLDRVEWNANQIHKMLRRDAEPPSKSARAEEPPPISTPPDAEPSPAVEKPSPAEEKPVEAIVLAEAISDRPKEVGQSESAVPSSATAERPKALEPSTPIRPDTAPPREPSRFEIAAKENLRKIGRWLLVGEEEVPEGVSLEYAIARNWLVRIGVLFVVLAISFFLILSIDRGWIDKTGQVLISSAVGLAMLVAGVLMLGRKYHLLGQGLIGAGIATLYLSVFATQSYCVPPLFDHIIAFALMMAITCLAGWIAVRFNSLLVAVLGILGGYGTPIMLKTGVVAYVPLYTYVLILGVGVLGISYKKNWRLLNYLAFAGTYILLFGSMREWKYTSQSFWQVMPFLIAFFILFSTMTFLFNLVNRKKSTLLEVLGLLVNAGVFFGASNWLIRDADFGKEWVAAVSLGLAAFYAAHVYYFLIRRMHDRELLLSFTALSAFFLAVTMPLLLSSQWVTASWAIQALVMLWMAGKLQSEFLRNVAYLLYAIVLFRFGFVDLREQYFAAAAADMPVGEFLLKMVERVMIFGIPIASLAGGGWLLQRSPPKPLLPIGEDNDIHRTIGVGEVTIGVMAAVAGMIFLALHLEMNRSLGFFAEPLRLPVLSLLWVGMCAFLLHLYRLHRHNIFTALFFAFAAGMLIKLFAFDLPAWHIGGNLLYGSGYSFQEGALRLLDFGAMIALLAFAWNLLRKSPDSAEAKTSSILFGTAALALLFIFLTLEVNTILGHYVKDMRAGGISILWAIYALGLVGGGMWKDLRAIRYVGLALFAVVAYKVLMMDLAGVDEVYRIIACILVGIVMLCGSFVYIKYRPAAARINEENGV